MSAILTTISELFAPWILAKAIPRVKIEEWSFRLHFRVTPALLFLFSALLCVRQYIGEHIKCQPNHDDEANDPAIPRKVIETYCFIQTTFTVRSHTFPPLLPNKFSFKFEAHALQLKVPYDPRMMSLDRIRTNKNVGGPQYIPGRTPRTHHAYYQWMPFYLFFLGLFFLLTHLIWKSIENGRVKSLVQELHVSFGYIFTFIV